MIRPVFRGRASFFWRTTVSGTYGTSSLWDFIGTGYVSDAYVSTGSDGMVAPACR